MGSNDQALSLNLGFPSTTTTTTTTASQKPRKSTAVDFGPSLTLSLSGGGQPRTKGTRCEEPAVASPLSGLDIHVHNSQSSPPSSGVSSPSALKREREAVATAASEEVEAADRSVSVSRALTAVAGSDDDEYMATHSNNVNIGVRKKLRLSKDQSAVMEESFKQHSTLNPKQKQALANQLNLRPRQVEVWFQNRRARTKLKQTEVDCEFLRNCCEKLTDENRRLQRELQELRAFKQLQAAAQPPPAPFYMQLPAATLTMCPSCERVCGGSSGGGSATGSKGGAFTMTPAKSHFFNPFATTTTTTNPSAGTAC